MTNHNLSPQAGHPSYEMSEWQARQRFVGMVGEVCEERGIDLEWMSQQWIARLERDGASYYAEGYVFPLNGAVAANIIRDKVSTSIILQHEGVPVIPHSLLRLPALRGTAGMADRAMGLTDLPMVIKPSAGESGGFDVMRCRSAEEVEGTIAELAKRHRALAVSPYVQINHEYRTVMLDGRPLLTFEKVRHAPAGAEGEWRHNLKLGARPVLQTNPAICRPLEEIASASMSAVRARLATVDTASTPDGLMVVEMNGGLTLDHFGAYSPEYAALAKNVYSEVIEASFRSI